jgi:hypothetical protein
MLGRAGYPEIFSGQFFETFNRRRRQMISETKMEIVKGLINSANPDALASKKGRRQLGEQIATGIGMFSGRVYDFLEEMAGLDLHNSEDRQLLLEFIERGL